MDYLKILHAIFFTRDELAKMLKVEFLSEIHGRLQEQGMTIAHLGEDKRLMELMTDKLSKTMAESKDMHEVFLALVSLPEFYEPDSKIGFVMKPGFNPKKDKINSIDSLNSFREENSPIDCIIASKDGMRTFQMKRYRDSLTTNDLTMKLLKILEAYGKDMGEINLLLILQSKDSNMDVDFLKVHEGLKEMEIKRIGSVLVFYNENNDYSVIVTVYPNLGVTRRPYKRASEKGIG